ncbi:hypothetical protein HPB50_023509 [Hyalomma asiaticum]|uniref:Uncharacterized protein n=1 Tax=Hyalomma asiaticum TaxID=266040 RepID=A0ACB7S9T7_HYAAI|nr:hypothetical protein HPB50_023509 [Hyalomma asiaticum]
MAWTSIPTTGDATSMILRQIHSQALLKVAERRFQDKTNRTASGDVQAAVSPVENAPATRATGCKGKASAKWKPLPVLKPASEDYVIVKPRERISLREAFTETSYGTAISVYLGPEQARAISVLPPRDQNIIFVHTPDIEAANRLIGDNVVNAEKRPVPLPGYLRQGGGNTCQRVIMVRDTDTMETLQHRVCWRAGTIVEIRKFGTSNKARVTFAAATSPCADLRLPYADGSACASEAHFRDILRQLHGDTVAQAQRPTFMQWGSSSRRETWIVSHFYGAGRVPGTLTPSLRLWRVTK